MKFGKNAAILFIVAAVIAVFAVPIHAQEATPEATAEATPECVVNTIVQTDPAGTAAFVAIAIYPGVDETKRGEFVQKVNEGFLPILEASDGFIGYILADLGKDGWMSMRIFETEEGAAASATAAKAWVADNIADLLPEAPKTYTGRVDLRVLKLCGADAKIDTMVQTDPTAAANFAAVAFYSGVDETRRGEFVQKVHDGFLPLLETPDSFIGYVMVDLGKDGWMAIRIFETEEGANASATLATAWAADHLADLLPEAPTRYAGRVDLRAFAVAAMEPGS